MQIVLLIMTYFIVFSIYRFFIIRKLKNKENSKPIEVSILEKIYKIDIEKLDYGKLLHVICLVSSLDITIIIILILLVDNFILQLLIALVLAFPIILASYSFIGRYYVKKGMIKNE